ncbi:NAD-dependent succinate-semialdehyde dehydrogenase [Zavarzinia compransoris]|uniref:NAD-dependent succinate-semialdehyde dehydrogenase n=1 Tax=Zavarzinia compransoris TaxID=1264899 RepID=A0A317E968_9PROT|nr:NAD-dependent succinate-semialdehyde dehydrogenase [Zavarzinia compransoris]PWR21655.1 NAD-dependent succinate-semialdehyde dehydrogenase [Zavarzinia compransoris]TDP45564.1 succinate semialdehyde dehydrogenase [Zavarzinia compransoris]
MSNETGDRLVPPDTPTDLFIGGQWRPAAGGRQMPVFDPATAQPFATVADGSDVDALAALDAAAAAQRDWARRAPRQRGEILRRSFEAMIARQDDLARLITAEMGKPLAESRAEVLYAAEFLRWFSEEAVRLDGRWSVAPEGGSRLVTMLQPVGPCYLILPWNVPLAMATRKIGPALAAGCTAVVKPAAQTPLSLNLLAVLMTAAGLPPGVLNIVATSDPAPVTDALMGDPRLRKMSFTGSTPVGRELARQAAGNLLRFSMELGGNAPFIVFEDADIGQAAREAMTAKLRNNGEACTAANRFLVHRSVAGDFAEALRTRFADLVVGPGLRPDVTLGPLINRQAVARIDALVRDAVAGGASLLYRGKVPDGDGHYYPPTILGDVPPDARIVTEEIFGPVAPIVSFDTEDEVLAIANRSAVGLASYVFTRDLDRALRVSEALEVGMVGLNRGILSNPAAPFGGVKASGYGREGGAEGIAEYVEVKYLALSA